MKLMNIHILGLVFILTSCAGQHKKINGVSFVASNAAIENKNVQPVLNINGNFVALMPFGFIRDLKTPEVQYNTSRQWFGETKKGLEHYAKEFKNSNVKIMVKPHLWVSRGLFTGLIEMDSESNWKIFEDSYEKYILEYADISQKMNVDILCIGTELEKFVIQRPEYWNQLIVKIKDVYKGKLTYAANWDEFNRVPFWSQLDYIGIDAYFPLSDEKSPTIADLEKGWEPHKKTIQQFQKKYNKQILFTEYGYRSVDYTGKQPWDSNQVEGSVNLEAQKNATQVLYNQFWKEDWFAGGFLWKWFHNHEDVGGENNNRFTPQNKPVEVLIKKLYGDQ